ncbi:MAG: hypothetical protein WC789_06650 [Lentisphaeria bacterium]
MERCKIKPAYHRSPAERLGAWLGDRFLRLLATALACIAIWFLIGWIVEGPFNLVAQGTAWGETETAPFSAAAPAVTAVRVTLCLFFGWFLMFRFRMARPH